LIICVPIFIANLLRGQQMSIVLNEHFEEVGSPYRSGRSPQWLKVKNPKAPAVKREAEEDWGR
jgi:hypothetical protein